MLFSASDSSFTEFAESTYRHFGLEYPRFHKMDNLCKLGFMAAEFLLKDNYLTSRYKPYEIGVILGNSYSSLDTDLRHIRQVEGGLASPAVFVYSLPNIVIGEICIRHGIKGENTFFVSGEYEIENQVKYISELMDRGKMEACLGGWVDYTGENYLAFLYVIEKLKGDIALPFNSITISNLFNDHLS